MTAVWVLAYLLLQGGPVAPDPGAADSSAMSPAADSVSLFREARSAQARFERIRIQNAPFTWDWSYGECTERVGRLCLQLTDRGREPDPWAASRAVEPENETVRDARSDLLEVLDRVASEIPGDGWVAGQRVRYRGEAGDREGARAAARACRSDRPGWCNALEALSAHALGEMAEADRLHRRALDEMDAEEREARLDPEWLVDVETWRALRDLEGEERQALTDRIWRWADPWYSTPWNELLVEHLSRHVRAEIREGSRTPYGFNWGDDLAQILVRFGEESGFERIHERSLQMGPPSVIGRGQPGARFLMPSHRALLEGEESPGPEDFSTERVVARSLHRAGQTRRIRDLRAQVARFGRGDSLLVAAAWEYPQPSGAHAYWLGVEADTLPPPHPEAPDVALMLLPREPGEEGDAAPVQMRGLSEDGERWVEVSGSGSRSVPGGFALALGPGGSHLVSIEVREVDRERGWRYRLPLDPLTRSGEGPWLSDLLLLEAGSGPGDAGAGSVIDEDGTLESVIDRALPSLRIPPGPVELAWEVYGLSAPVDVVSIVLEVGEAERGVLRRLGEALRILSERVPTRLRWEESFEVRAEGEAHFRRLRLDLSELSDGSHDLRLVLSGREGDPVEARLRIEIDSAAR